MFVNKINGIANIGFKSLEHVKNDIGQTVTKFNYVYDPEKETCEIHIFRVIQTDKYNYKLVETPIAKVDIKPDGTIVNIQNVTNLDKNDPYVYKVVRKDKNTGDIIWEGADTGMKLKEENGELVFRVANDAGSKEIKDSAGNVIGYKHDYNDSIDNYKYTLVTRNGTTPRVQGAGYLLNPDSFVAGARYAGFNEDNTGSIIYDKDEQKRAENTVKNFSNVLGGSLAGMQMKLPYLKEMGYKILPGNPIANGSNAWSLGYWNKNNNQMSNNVGNIENFSSFSRDLYVNGMKFVYDGTFTSGSLEDPNFQYAQRWADKNPQTYYWFRMSGIKDSNLGLGVIPKNAEHLRHRVINAPYNYELQTDGTYKKVANPSYNAKKETLFQIYDASQVGENQIKTLDKAIVNYERLKEGRELDFNSHDDTIINYVFQINPKEYDSRIDAINELNKINGYVTKLDSTDGTILAGQFSTFKIDKKTEGGFVAWDANTDMVKKNYHISGYDEKLLQSIVNPFERAHERKMIERGAIEVQDMAIQSGKYWTGKVKDIQTLYTAQTIGSSKTIEAIDKLIKDGKLPQEAKLNSNALNNILNGYYLLAPKGILSKDDATVKALMRTPIDTLEFGENTVGVLQTSYFSNRATTEETIGVSRFDLMKQGNPHLVKPYTKNYQKVEALYTNQIKNFADAIIKKVNETSNEKLLDSNGNYTEYGEYVIELVGQDITKYAFLKSLTGKNLKTKTLNNGEITYDYDAIKEGTTLKALDINATNPEEEASILERKIERGLDRLSPEDISYVANSISKRIAGTDTSSFRLAEAIVDRASLGLDWRLDACKDVIDMDAIRNEENSFDDNWNDVIKFQAKFVEAIKSENPDSYIVAEITDIPDLMKDTYGSEACPYDGKTNIGQKFNGEPDALSKFFAQTGITSEAGYSYFFTDLLTSFAPDFEKGNRVSPYHDDFANRLNILIQTRSADYLRNLYTFMGNHDKPRMIHGLALDMSLFHANLLNDYKDFNQGHDKREMAIKVLSGAKNNADIPIELRLNVDNNNYFKTVSPRAVAMSKLLMDVINENLGKITNDNDKSSIINALIDLTNGNYLGIGKTENLQKINIKELSSLNNAFEEILNLASNSGLKLSSTERKTLIDAVVKKANEMDINNYLVHGDFDWMDINLEIKAKNIEHAKDILGEQADYSKYSLYTVQIAKLLKDAYKETKLQKGMENAINAGLKQFAEKYDKANVVSHTADFSQIEDPVMAMRKNGYAARDIKTAIMMAVKQAEFKSGKEIQNKQEIINTIYKYATEPAVAKASMIMSFLSGLPGIPTMYGGDEFGLTGYEEKAKNVYLQNRNALPWTEIEGESSLAKYRRTIMNSMNSAMQNRSNPELNSLNVGTPYSLEVQANSRTRSEMQHRLYKINEEINELNKKLNADKNNKTLITQIEKLEAERRVITKDLAKIAYLMQSSNGDMTVTLFNAGDIEFSNRFDYFKKYGLDTEAKRKKFFKDNNIDSIDEKNPYIPIMPKSELDSILLGAGIAIPLGTVFINANSKDRTEYVVKEINGRKAIVRKDGKKIIMDGMTAKNGVMILKHIKKIIFKGNPQNNKSFNNTQYHFAPSSYKITEAPEEGKKLSIMSK